MPARKPKLPKGPVLDRQPARRYAAAVAVENLKTLKQFYRDRNDERGTLVGLADRAKVGKSTIGDILTGEHDVRSMTVAVLHKLAGAFELQAWQLLVPNLNPTAPPQLMTPEQLHKINRFEEMQRIATLPARNEIGEHKANDDRRTSGGHRHSENQASVHPSKSE